MISNLKKRKPDMPVHAWNELDDIAIQSHFDFRAADISLFNKEKNFKGIAPKDSLSRASFWITREDNGRIHVKCNRRREEKSVDLIELQSILKKQTKINELNIDQQGLSSDLTDSESLEPQIKVTVIPEPKIVLKIPSPEKAGRKEVIIHKKGGASKRVKISTQRYRFLDWEKNTKDKYMKPTGQGKMVNLKKIPLKQRKEIQNIIETSQPRPKAEQTIQVITTFTDANLVLPALHQRVADVVVLDSDKLVFNKATYRMERESLRTAGIFQELTEIDHEDKPLEVRKFFDVLQKGDPPASDRPKREQNYENHRISDESSRSRFQQDFGLFPSQQVIDVDECHPIQRPRISLVFQAEEDMIEKSIPLLHHDLTDSAFQYSVICPPYSTDDLGDLNVTYQEMLADVYKHNPVCSQRYYYLNTPAHLHDKAVIGMIKRLDYKYQDEKVKDIQLVLRQFNVEENEKPSLLARQLEVSTRPKFKYVLIKVGLDNKLEKKDLEALNPQELHMMVAFFNVKFCILNKEDKLIPSDTMERIMRIANRHISNVLQRAHNFKKNEEFLKKKWKEFLKFCKLKIKQVQPPKSMIY